MKKSMLLLLVLAGCNGTSTSPTAPIAAVQPEVVPTCEVATEVALQLTDVQFSIFVSVLEQTNKGTWTPKIPFTITKRKEDFTKDFVFVPDNPLCESATVTVDVPAVVCPNRGVFDPNTGRCRPNRN